MRIKPLITAALVGASVVAMAAPASAAEIFASLSDAGTARTWYSRTVVEVCDKDADTHAVAGEYYRSASPSTLRTKWNETGVSTCASSDDGSSVLKLRVREQIRASEDRYGSWYD